MGSATNGSHPQAESAFDRAWRDQRAYLLDLASRMLGDRAEAEDVVQDAFDRLAAVDIATIDNERGWLTVVVRRLCLNRISSAYRRRESVRGDLPSGAGQSHPAGSDADPVDRITLDEQVRLALAIVLDRLSPAERTAFVLHDVFGFPFDGIAELVGRSPAACRQLASRARRSLQSDDRPIPPDPGLISQRDVVAERFSAACAGGDLRELMELLDPDVVGEAILEGHGPIGGGEGRDEVAARIIGLFGPGSGTTLVPVSLEGRPGVMAMVGTRVMALMRLDEVEGVVHHIHSFVCRRS